MITNEELIKKRQHFSCSQNCSETNIVIGYFSGGRLNKKDGLTRYGNSHVKDKTS